MLGYLKSLRQGFHQMTSVEDEAFQLMWWRAEVDWSILEESSVDVGVSFSVSTSGIWSWTPADSDIRRGPPMSHKSLTFRQHVSPMLTISRYIWSPYFTMTPATWPWAIHHKRLSTPLNKMAPTLMTSIASAQNKKCRSVVKTDLKYIAVACYPIVHVVSCWSFRFLKMIPTIICCNGDGD